MSDTQRNFEVDIYDFVVSTVPADCPGPLHARITVGSVVTKIEVKHLITNVSSLYKIIAWALTMKLLSDECNRTSPMSTFCEIAHRQSLQELTDD